MKAIFRRLWCYLRFYSVMDKISTAYIVVATLYVDEHGINNISSSILLLSTISSVILYNRIYSLCKNYDRQSQDWIKNNPVDDYLYQKQNKPIYYLTLIFTLFGWITLLVKWIQ